MPLSLNLDLKFSHAHLIILLGAAAINTSKRVCLVELGEEAELIVMYS